MSESGHLTPEDMVARGEPFSQFDDLPGLPPQELARIMQLCPEEPDVESIDFCVPCRAFMVLSDGGGLPAEPSVPEGDTWTEDMLAAQDDGSAGGEVTAEPFVTPFEEPVVERFRKAVHGLSEMVAELLEGPPIPPPNVSEEELALLVVAAQRWIAMTEAQGVELGGTQKAVFDATKTLVARMHRG